MSKELDLQTIKTWLRYDPQTGLFTWNFTRGNARKGDVAGAVASDGYRRIRLLRKSFASGRLAWLYMTGEWPKDQIDHINRIRSDDRFCNLREATCAENIRYRVMKPGSYMKGVKRSRGGLWLAQIGFNHRKVHLGTFRSELEAHQAYLNAAKEMHGEFRSTEWGE